jgi:phosphoribosylglycinamide formyltransferase-1
VEQSISNKQSAMGNEQAGNEQEPQTTNLKPQTNIAIFASGAGSNAQKIIDHFKQHSQIKIALIVCNKPGAGVLTIAQKEGIPTLLIEKEKFFSGNAYVDELKQHNIQFIVLAGFLWKIPVALIAAYPQRIINIHPALLPNYGGKGMYGHFVHEAVIAAKEKESGISIHYVDELYDHGQLIFQARCTIEPGDTPDTLAQKIHILEHTHYPAVVEKVIRELQNRR